MTTPQHRHGQELTWELLAAAADLPCRAIQFTGMTANFQAFQGRGVLTGYTLQNQNAAAQTFNVLDGQDASGSNIVLTGPGASSRNQIALPGKGVYFQSGLFVVCGAGPFNGAFYVIDLKQQLGIPWPGQG